MEEKEIIFDVICDFISEELFKSSEDEISKKIRKDYRTFIKQVIEDEFIEYDNMVKEIIHNSSMYIQVYELPIEKERFICMLIEGYNEL